MDAKSAGIEYTEIRLFQPLAKYSGLPIGYNPLARKTDFRAAA